MLFEVPPGACLLVVGPSGSGKSSLARAIAGLVPETIPGRVEGHLTVDGLEVPAAGHEAVARHVGVVFQDPESQLVMERVEDDVAFGLERRGWSPEAMRSRVPEALVEMGLGGMARRRTTRLSGGEQQRLALAGAIAPRPSILILDEPTSSLDPAGALALARRLAAVRAARSTTIVLVEHRAELAWPLADLVLALGPAGEPIAFGAADRVLAEHGSELATAGVWLPGPAVDPNAARAYFRAVSGESPAATGEPRIRASGVRFEFERGVPVLDGIDLELRDGARVALLGANGSGKSTLGRLLVGLLRPVAGAVRLGGLDPARLRPAALSREAAYVWQDPERQFLAATVRSELELGLADDERHAAGEAAERLRLPLAAFGERSPYTLSGGEQRRLSLATALVRRPRLLVLDEPTFGQDRHGYEQLVDMIQERVAAGAAVVAATHDLRFADDVATRTIVLAGGRIAWDGPTDRLSTSPALHQALGLPPDVPAGFLPRGGRGARGAAGVANGARGLADGAAGAAGAIRPESSRPSDPVPTGSTTAGDRGRATGARERRP